jgi:glycosyltransferase involved in cell wall biosynthesis
MLSICIPIYNHDIRPLIDVLEKQISLTNTPIDIILIDDGSEVAYHQINEAAATMHQYIRLECNIGRAKVRNLFLNYTDTPYLLFLDCDVTTPPEFIGKYLSIIQKEQPDVVCGGRNYPTSMADDSKLLSYRYGIHRESKNAAERKKNPNDSFMTNNFAIKRAVFKQFPFDESISGYGHEDTLLGFDLKKGGIEITHIENPVINGGIETNAIYLQKTDQAITNLVHLVNSVDSKETFIKSVRLLRVYYYSLNKGARVLLRIIFRLTKNLLVRILVTGRAPIWLFDCYKLGILGEKLDAEKRSLTQKID